MSLEIIKAGTFTTVQDTGRLGLAHMGVPVSGTMDDQAAQLANWMVGNRLDEAVLEITWTGIELLSHSPCVLAIAGAEFDCVVNNKAVSTDAVIHLRAGDTFNMRRLQVGVRAYLAVAGGLGVDPVAGSCSTLTVAHLGGINGRQVQAGDRLNVTTQKLTHFRKKPAWKKLKARKLHVIRATPGPEFDWLEPSEIHQAFGQAYQLSHHFDRQGFRLQAEPLKSIKTTHLQSSGLVAGSLQVTPDGQTILAMHDAQTIGGYPRILVVNQDELHKLAQVRPHESIYFFVGRE
jgi:biotin-dependent carboxylase-like uncharacterized protein